jgi:MFS family permease
MNALKAGRWWALAAALLPGGLLGDRYGRKKVLLGALALFGAGSLALSVLDWKPTYSSWHGGLTADLGASVRS